MEHTGDGRSHDESGSGRRSAPHVRIRDDIHRRDRDGIGQEADQNDKLIARGTEENKGNAATSLVGISIDMCTWFRAGPRLHKYIRENWD